MVGRAGTGKTHTLGTAPPDLRARRLGPSSVSLRPPAPPASCRTAAGIASTTIARHRVEQRTITATTAGRHRRSRDGRHPRRRRDRRPGHRRRRQGVLVGDHHQLPEVAAGGAFRAALDTLGDRVVELTVNRRQHHEWERAALDELRCGDVATAFAAYRDHGRVVIADEARGPPRHRPRRLARRLRRRRRRAPARRHPRRGPPAQPPRPPDPRRPAASSTSPARSPSPAAASWSATRSCCAGTTRTSTSPTARPFAVDNGMRGTVTVSPRTT